MKTIRIFLFALPVSLVACNNSKINEEAQDTPQFVTSNPWVHDPVMAKEGETYHIFNTGQGISHLVSPDMVNWTMEKPVFEELPEWVTRELPVATLHIWAPDVIFHNGLWHIFYSCSAFGKNTSLIGHATAESLASGVWEDCGMMVKSVPERDMWNAIDPNIVEDNEGQMWMTFGSFWDGIMLVKLKKDLSGIAEPQEWHRIAHRHRSETMPAADAGDGAIEAPFIFKKNGYYYLFASTDYCCRGKESTYKVIVGRSERVEGPYVDAAGVELLHDGGTIVVEGDKVNWQAIGHNSAYTIDGHDYFVAHAYDIEKGTPRLFIRKMNWNEGWPVLE